MISTAIAHNPSIVIAGPLRWYGFWQQADLKSGRPEGHIEHEFEGP